MKAYAIRHKETGKFPAKKAYQTGNEQVLRDKPTKVYTRHNHVVTALKYVQDKEEFEIVAYEMVELT